VSTVELEQYLFLATLFRVQPAGFGAQLARVNSHVSVWDVSWVEATDSISTEVLTTPALSYVAVNITAQPAAAARLPLPRRGAAASGGGGNATLLDEYQLTHVGDTGLSSVVVDAGVSDGGGGGSAAGSRELIMLTTNVTFKQQPRAAAPGAGGGGGNASLHELLQAFLADTVARAPLQRHVVVGIVTPPVTLDLAYTQRLVALPPTMPPGYFGLVNVMAAHLAQGPRASQPDATVLLPDVWTHLLWSIPRTPRNVVTLSNVTLWVPAAEFSFIRSHTADHPTSFTINLQGGVAFAGGRLYCLEYCCWMATASVAWPCHGAAVRAGLLHCVLPCSAVRPTPRGRRPKHALL
jgi:hypothetical protein